jgi:hypothetical protein
MDQTVSDLLAAARESSGENQLFNLLMAINYQLEEIRRLTALNEEHLRRLEAMERWG